MRVSDLESVVHCEPCEHDFRFPQKNCDKTKTGLSHFRTITDVESESLDDQNLKTSKERKRE